jgi:hypothetical protein
MSQPILRHIVNLWSMVHYPSADQEWSLAEKLRAAKSAGFDGYTTRMQPEHARLAKKLGLIQVGYFSTSDAGKFAELCAEQRKAGARTINVQLADDDTPVPVSVGLALLLLQEGQRQDLDISIEVHRDTCTETPEKTYAIAEAYQQITGKLMPLTWDFSHLSVVKHLGPSNYIQRLLTRPDLIQRANQLHLRPFNGHHCQVPVTDGRGNLTRELQEWLPFAEALLKMWLDGNRDTGRELYVVPEMGPAMSGYNFSVLPNSWEDAQVLRVEIDRIWQRLTKPTTKTTRKKKS